ncbi:alanine racemase [Sinorhizobium meliloti]|uniref:alanine racemase n=1 Tax=Rhizobium meliloti TaxID=382 RepID=UPI00040B6264|nr:alanine racemase [Sinorhizobium meliloti]MDE3823626.1 alanine racemase [Sinorhizobium meliloti]UFX12883.1 alanine racemase [Sinorhizobium meliloti]
MHNLDDSSTQNGKVEDSTRANWMRVDLLALENNFKIVRSLLPKKVRIHASVKSAAYGLDIGRVARRFVELGAEAISCGSFDDARTIRETGLLDIDMVMFGGTLPAGIATILRSNIMPTVHNIELAEAVAAVKGGPWRVYIKVDCGWGRLGFPLRTAKETILQIAKKKNIAIEGIYTHLPFTNANGAVWAQQRTNMFDEFIADLRRSGLEVPVTQARSSSGVLFGLTDECNAVAPGSILYGKPSLEEGTVDFSNFRSVLASVHSRLIHVSNHAADKTLGYEARFAHAVQSTTGVIPFGRKDGGRMPQPGQDAYMIVNGAKAPILSVSSEQTVLDLSNVPDPVAGDEVLIVGERNGLRIDLSDLARWQGTGMNDVLLMMRERMPQHVIG